MKLNFIFGWILLGSTVSMTTFYLIGNIIANKNMEADQIEYSRILLKNAETVTEQIILAFERAKHLNINSCDSNKINELRLITSKFQYIQDIGFVNKGTIICTANWGVLDQNSELPVPNHVNKKGYKFYTQVFNSASLRQPSDVTQFDNLIVVTSRFAFSQFQNSPPKFSYKLASLDEKHVFISSEGLINYSVLNKILPRKDVSTKVCSDKYMYCVFTKNSFGGIFFTHTNLILFLFFLIAFMGGSTSFLIVSNRMNAKSLQSRLKKAIVEQNIYLEYQPIILTKTQEIVGVEALIRWKDDIYGQVSPELFINIAEKIGVYNKISEFVINTALIELKEILIKKPDFFLSLNINTLEIRKTDFLTNLSKLVRSLDISTSQIKLEITEKTNESCNNITLFSQSAKQEGFVVSLDDFGTGASNILWLMEIDFDEIKLDKIFIQGLHDETNKYFFIGLLNAISKLNKRIVFEGVELQSDYEYICKHNSLSLIQGWYFYRSLPANKIKKIILSTTITNTNPA